jgi:protocatechuate 3,4-dioxygenase beta subunit
MRRHRVLLLILALLIQIDAPKLAQTGTRIEGVVVHAETGAPLPRVQVVLTRPSSGEATARFVTDVDGKFQFSNIPAGQYEVEAARNGYILQNSRVTIAANRPVTELAFRLVATGVVTGRVRDSRGEPAVKVTVAVMRLTFDGLFGRHLTAVTQDVTDDRGEYRIYGVPPGQYLVRADSPADAKRLSAAVPKDDQIAPVYYPGASTPFGASPIEVRGGFELGGVDVPLSDVPFVRIRGRIVDDATGRPPAAYAGALLIPRQSTELLPYSLLTNTYDRTYNESTGAFEILRVVPGTYWIRVSASLSSPAGRTNVSALSPVTVGTQDLDGVNIVLKPNTDLKGTISSDGDMSRLPFRTLRLTLRPTYGGEAPFTPGNGVNADGSFVLPGIATGEYRFTAELSPALYLKEAKLGGVDVLNEPFTVSGPTSDVLNVVLGSRPGQINGVFLDSLRKPIAGSRLVLVPDRSRTRVDLYRGSLTDSDGKFRFQSIAPGDYKIFTDATLASGGFFERDINPQFELLGTAVHVDESSNLTIEVKSKQPL